MEMEESKQFIVTTLRLPAEMHKQAATRLIQSGGKFHYGCLINGAWHSSTASGFRVTGRRWFPMARPAAGRICWPGFAGSWNTGIGKLWFLWLLWLLWSLPPRFWSPAGRSGGVRQSRVRPSIWAMPWGVIWTLGRGHPPGFRLPFAASPGDHRRASARLAGGGWRSLAPCFFKWSYGNSLGTAGTLGTLFIYNHLAAVFRPLGRGDSGDVCPQCPRPRGTVFWLQA